MEVKVGFLVKDLEGLGIYSPRDDFRQATVSQWHKNSGDFVQEGECLAIIETDKVTQELLSPASGVIKSINYQDGEKWEYGGEEQSEFGEILIPELCVIETEKSPEKSVEEEILRENGEEAAETTPPQTADVSFRGRFTPVAWNILNNHGLDPGVVADAFGDEGKIGKDFVNKFIESSQSPSREGGIIPAVPAARRLMQETGIDPILVEHSGEAIARQDVERYRSRLAEQPADETSKAEESGRVPMGASQLRKTVARLLQRSWREIPHAGDTISINVTRLKAFRDTHKDVWRALTGYPLRYDHFFMFLAAKYLAIEEFRILNAYWDEDAEEAFVFRDVNLGIAVQTPAGLMVPVVHGAQKLSFVELHKSAEDKIERALSGKIKIPDLRDLTFTVNNPGAVGGEHPDPIIPYTVESGGKERPTGMILAFGKMEYSTSKTGYYMNVTFKFDHRLVDGVPAIRFVIALKNYIESKSKPEEFKEMLEPDFSIKA